MKRRFNSTGRKPIASNLVHIRLVHPAEDGQPMSFDADLSRLKELELPGEGRVYVEPYVTGSSSIMRFSFGTIDAIEPPADRLLADLDVGGRIVFRIKVVDESSTLGRILAASHAIRPYDERIADDQRRSILPVEVRDLGEAVWKLDMVGSDRPTLLLSHRVPNFMEKIRTDPFVQGTIVPHAVRQILVAIYHPEEGETSDDAEWVQDWKRWMSEFLGTSPDEDWSPDVVERRVDDIVDRFARKWRFASRIDPAAASDSPSHE
jgi:hypothetical protein